MPNAFAFILNPLEYSGTLPIELFPGARLDRADSAQIILIEELRDKLGRAGESMALRHEPIPDEVRKSPEWDGLLPGRKTFWVIDFDIHPTFIAKFRQASVLTDNELEIGAIFPPQEQPFVPRIEFPWAMESYFDMSWRNDAEPLNVGHLSVARILAEKIHRFRQEQDDDPAKSVVVRVFDDFIDLSREHRIGHLVLLGHFALIEALITHDPAESGRRLSHQVRTKMPLLMRRFHEALALDGLFPNLNAQELWALLYRLRSSYAHGEQPDFAKCARQLHDLYTVFRFVRESLKRLLILALDEPNLVHDLKLC